MSARATRNQRRTNGESRRKENRARGLRDRRAWTTMRCDASSLSAFDYSVRNEEWAEIGREQVATPLSPLNARSVAIKLRIDSQVSDSSLLSTSNFTVTHQVTRRLQFVVAAASCAAALLLCAAPSVIHQSNDEVAARYSQRGRVARFYGRSSQRGVTAPPQSGRQGQWSRGTIPLGS